MKNLKLWSRIISFIVTVLILCHFVLSCRGQTNGKEANEKINQEVEKETQEIKMKTPKKKVIREPFDIWAHFIASGYMGDIEGEEGKKYIQFFEACKENSHSAPICIKITYTPGPVGWGGLYWHNKPENWGDLPGKNFQNVGYKKVTFWAKGENGGEVVEFKAGGINAPGKKHRDSFVVSSGKVVLEKDWKQYTIDLEGQDLSSVIGGFCWIAGKAANPSGLTFYLDDIYFEF